MRALARYAGTAIALLLLVVFILRQNPTDFRGIDFKDTFLWASLAGAMGLYTLVIFMGAIGWRLLLAAFDEPLPLWTAERQLLLSQIGKYIPGNVAHLLGRAALAVKDGVPKRAIGGALLAETALTVLGGLMVTALGLWLAADETRQLLALVPDTAPIVALLGTLAVLIVGFTIIAFLSARTRIAALPNVRLGPLCAAGAVYVISFVILGMTLHFIAQSVSPTASPALALSIAVFSLAWIVGLITPGAPGGLGVRDAIMTLGLAPIIGAPEALSVAVLHRAISVAGDVLAFAIGLWLPTRSRS